MAHREGAVAVDPVDQDVEDADREDQEGVDDQLVPVDGPDQEGYRQLEEYVEDGKVGVDGHPLVGDDRRVERRLQDRKEGGEDGELVHDIRRAHPFRRDIHDRVEEPQADGFSEQDNHEPDQKVRNHRRGKHLPLRLGVSLGNLGGDVALRRAGEARVDEGEKDDDPADDVVDAVVLYPERMEDNPGGIERDHQDDKHPQVHVHRILCDAYVAF